MSSSATSATPSINSGETVERIVRLEPPGHTAGPTLKTERCRARNRPAVLAETLRVRRRLGDPGAAQTQLLERLPSRNIAWDIASPVPARIRPADPQCREATARTRGFCGNRSVWIRVPEPRQPTLRLDG